MKSSAPDLSVAVEPRSRQVASFEPSWLTVAGPFVVANGTEGEPASMKDRVLLTRAPHLVLDGAALAASLVGATEVIMVVHREARESVDAALAERRRVNLDARSSAL